MIFDSNISEKLYPLIWLSGEYKGTGLMGGNFGLDATEFQADIFWDPQKEDGEELYSFLQYGMTISANNGLNIEETGIWKQSKNKPEILLNTNQFPLDVQIKTRVTLNNQKNDTIANKTQSEETNYTWETNYVGLAGGGKIELLSDEINLIDVNYKIGDHFVNDLYRSKRMFGNVNQRILWAWDLAFLGTPVESFASGALLKN